MNSPFIAFAWLRSIGAFGSQTGQPRYDPAKMEQLSGNAVEEYIERTVWGKTSPAGDVYAMREETDASRGAGFEEEVERLKAASAALKAACATLPSQETDRQVAALREAAAALKADAGAVNREMVERLRSLDSSELGRSSMGTDEERMNIAEMYAIAARAAGH